jgi:hypothetical protein
LFRYGLTPAHGGVTALHNIWGLSSPALMAGLSLLIVALYAAVALLAAVRLFSRRGTG